MKISDYSLRGGVEGRERLRILGRVMRPTANALLQRAGLCGGKKCLDAGCGGGDLAFDMARIVGASGSVVGIDIDTKALDLARAEAADLGLANIEFRQADITESSFAPEFDLVHARFLLSHLPDPAEALLRLWGALRPGGVVVLEDTDFRGHFSYPELPALDRFVELYGQLLRRRGADSNIGARLPSLVAGAGFENVQMNIVQPAGITGEVKLMTPITMENIGPAVIAAGLAPSHEIAELVNALYEYARTPGTVGCLPRVMEVWATKPA
ncbi:MAG TPA: class I SAM-dependent methyltransferase [Acidobacteriaceae bacterium]|nr:class I SAM-dependent methyltransferase [Acidobacteriaceae bacterium]